MSSKASKKKIVQSKLKLKKVLSGSERDSNESFDKSPINRWDTTINSDPNLELLLHRQGFEIDARDKETSALRETTLEKAKLDPLRNSNATTNLTNGKNRKKKASQLRMSLPDMRGKLPANPSQMSLRSSKADHYGATSRNEMD